MAKKNPYGPTKNAPTKIQPKPAPKPMPKKTKRGGK